MTESPDYLGRVLVVDDDPDMHAVLRSRLEYDGFRVDACDTLDGLKAKIRQFSYDAVLLDLCLGEETGVEALPFLVREAPFTVVIVMTAYGTIELAVEAMGKGAATFLTKTGDPGKITSELTRRLRPGLERVAAAGLGDGDVFATLGVIGQSVAMREVLDDLVRCRDVDGPVLICGESGTGKELVARAVHRLSARARGPFEVFNCGAIPEALLASELFGDHDGEAVSDPAGATRRRRGVFAACRDGTVVLDEIGDAPLDIQARLVQALRDGTTAHGAAATVAAEARVIACTQRDLEDEVGRGRFREDLFAHLGAVVIFLPPLRERRDDVPLLLDAFVERFNLRYGKAVRRPGHDLPPRLAAYDWPGNVRELQNAVERAVVLSRDGELHLEDLFQAKAERRGGSEAPGASASPAAVSLSYAEAKESFERSFLLRVLSAAKGSITEAARISGRYRSDIYRLLDKYGLSADEFKG